MKILHIIKLCALSLLALAIKANTVSYTIDLDKVANGDYSKLFSLYDHKTNSILAADFINGGGTFMSNNHYQVNIYTDTTLTLQNKKDIGKPFPEASGVKIFTLNNKLYAIRYESATSVMEYDSSLNKWVKSNIFPNFFNEVIFDIRKYQNHILSVTSKNVYIDNNIFYSSPLKSKVRYAKLKDNKLYLITFSYTSGHSSFMACNIKDHSLQDCSSTIIDNKMVDILANGNYDGKFYISTHSGEIYYIENDNIYNLYTKPDPSISFQIYSMYNIGDSLLLGQYPQGKLYKISENILTEFYPAPPINPPTMNNHRELQTINKVKGHLITGIWPWGEVWSFYNNKWTLQTRLFSLPKITEEQSPYYNQTLERFDSEFDRFGQRVPSIVSIGNKIYITTSSKSGIDHDFPNFIDNPLEYGKVYEFEVNNSLTCEISHHDNKKYSKLKFVVENTKITLLQDDNEICSNHIDKN